jgi:hypothetical protein
MKPFGAVSPSSLLDFEGCPKRYYEVRVLKKFPFQVTEAITYGNVVHEQLEKYVKVGEVLPEHLEFVKPIIDGLTEGGFTLYAELECAIDEQWNALSFWSKTAWLRGKVDLIAIKDDFAMVIDYKTGKRKPDPTQLKIYGAMLKAVLGLKRVESCYLWLKTKEGDTFDLTDENFNEVKTEITERIGAMKEAYEAENFPARTSPLCGWCPALDTCKDAIYYKVQRDKRRGK